MQIKRLHIQVYSRIKWTDNWQIEPHIEPLTADVVMAPSIGTAILRLRYGKGQWEDWTSLLSGAEMREMSRIYIQIRVSYNADMSEAGIYFTGFIPAEQFDILGDNPIETVDLEVMAYDLAKLLEVPLTGAWVDPVGDDDTAAVWIDSLPKFNKRYKHEWEVEGNRSTSKYVSPVTGAESYVFSEDGEVWTNADIVEYLLAYYQPKDGPVFSMNWLKENDKDILEALGQIKNIYDPNNLLLIEMINTLISRSRGLTWTTTALLNDNVEIAIFSLLDADLTINEIKLPKNSHPLKANLWKLQMDSKVTVVKDSRNVADKITVRGAKMKTCFTAEFSDNTLEKAWTDALETAYKNAAKDITGYDELDDDRQATANDRYRGADRFHRVFSSFRLPRTFNWKKGLHNLIPLLDPATGELDINKNAAYWNIGKRILHTLPFKKGIDFSDVEEDDENPLGSEPEYKPILAIVKGPDDKYFLAEKFCTEIMSLSAAIRPMRAETGVEVKFSPAYLAAKNHWPVSAEPGLHDITDEDSVLSCDYEDTLVTVFVETDQYVKLEYSPAADTAKDITNHKIIDIPAAQLWYVVPGTIIDIAADGTLLAYGADNPAVIKDDRDLLKGILVAAAVWYCKPKYKVNITSDSLDAMAALGDMLIDIDPEKKNDQLGSVITHLSFYFSNQKTIIDTDFGELNFAAIATGRRRAPSATKTGTGSAAEKIKHLTGEIEEIKEQLGSTPQRFDIPTGNGGGQQIYAKIIETLSEPDYTADPETESQKYAGIAAYKCRLITDKTAVWVIDTPYIIGSKCLGSNNLKYISKTGDLENPNTGHDPVADTEHTNWEIDEEIRVDFALGFENMCKIWNGDDTYHINDIRKYAVDGQLWKSKNTNSNVPPPSSETAWEKTSLPFLIWNGDDTFYETNIVYNPGNKLFYVALTTSSNVEPPTSSTAWKLTPRLGDLRNFSPQIAVGEEVILVKKKFGDEYRYYIQTPSLRYTGKPEEASIRNVLSDDGGYIEQSVAI